MNKEKNKLMRFFIPSGFAAQVHVLGIRSKLGFLLSDSDLIKKKKVYKKHYFIITITFSRPSHGP